jgi:Subtilase family
LRLHRVLLALVAAAALVVPTAHAASVAPPSMRQLVTALGGRANDAAGPRYAALRKLDGRLQGLAADRLQHRAASAPATGGLSISGGRVLVDVYVAGDPDAAAQELRATGMDVTHVSHHAPERAVEGWLPIDRATGVAALGATHAVVPATGVGLDAGGTLSEGDTAMHGPQARALGPNGAGVPLGVISDSIDRAGGGVAASQASGDLPANVQVLQDGPAGSTDEGRAMAEIAYDEAPGIPKILFSTGATGAVQKASSIDALVAHGAKVIVDDTYYIGEPFFQDGVVAQAVDRARAAGVAYVSSAGNRARQGWEGTFTPAPGNPALNDFDPGGAPDTFQTIDTVPAHQNRWVELQWDEPWGAAPSSFQVNVYLDGLPFYSTSNAAGIPSVYFNITLGSLPHALRIQIQRLSGSGPVHLRYIAGGNATYSIAEYATNSPTIDPDAASARGALTVGAVDAGQPGLDAPEPFSSRGPVTRLLDAAGTRLAAPDVRAKPDLAAADDVATSVAGFRPFLGTSAAAPSAAGVAALLLSAKPSMTVDELYALMRSPAAAIPCAAPAIGTAADDCGAGFLLADAALHALDSTPPAISVATSPAAPNAAGWFNRPVVPRWSLSDPETTIGTRSGCDATPLAADGVDTAVCTAASLGGTASKTLTVKVDTTPPSAPQIAGIAARRYTAATLPRERALRCRASDPTSGVARCWIAGFTSRSGTHVLTATAVDGAGLSSTSTLRYSIAPTIASGAAPRAIAARALARDGLPVRIHVSAARTRVTVSLALSVRAHGRRRVVVLGRLGATVGAGTHTLHVRLSAVGRRLLAAHRGATLALTIVGARGRVSTTLAGSVRARG